MPSAKTLERFIARVESNAHVEAIEEFYTDDGSVRRIEELAGQRWQGERIRQEQFFHDPAQFAARPPLARPPAS